jgi:zinc transport system substrate-binding protein
MQIRQVIFLTALFLAFSLLNPFSLEADEASISIYTVNYPLKYFAERIAGEHATVVFPAPKEVDPAYWMPDRKTISDYQKADLILLNGAHYAKWTEKVSLPGSKMADTSKKFKARYIKTEEAVTHSHGPGGDHAHEGAAFTTWLDFNQAAKQAEAILKALSRKRPALKTNFKKNYASLERDLLTLDSEIKEIVLNNGSQPIIGSHPVYQYFARRYGLNIKSVHWEPDEIPGVGQWQNFQNILKDHPAQWMIWEAEPLKKSVEIVAVKGVNSIVFDSCGNVPEEGDFLSVMRKNIENLKLAF